MLPTMTSLTKNTVAKTGIQGKIDLASADLLNGFDRVWLEGLLLPIDNLSETDRVPAVLDEFGVPRLVK